MSKIRARLLKRFRDPEYRHSYLESFLNSVVSMQIRALRERKTWTQEKLATEIGTTQSVVSRIESPDYSGWRIDTLRKVARAFDMALSVKFVSHGDAIADIERFGEDKLIRPEFKNDPVFSETENKRFTTISTKQFVNFVEFRERRNSWPLLATAGSVAADPPALASVGRG